MNREVHVRFWEGLAVRFRWATQLPATETTILLFYSMRAETHRRPQRPLPALSSPGYLIRIKVGTGMIAGSLLEILRRELT